MGEVKDPKIKLFGKTIELPDASAVAAEDDGAAVVQSSGASTREDGLSEDPPCLSNLTPEDSNLSEEAEEQESRKTVWITKHNHSKEENEPGTSEEFKGSNSTPPTVQDSNAPSADSDAASAKMPPKLEEDQSEASNSQEKTLKKPDKILPCPRCNSMDTKFCYFNNYNVNQPRHFCRNCQRYWTAGGTMRNVPVGAGRRKNKGSVSQFHSLTVPEGRLDLPNGIHHPALNPSGTVLSFSTDSPLCESMSSVLNTIDKTIRNNTSINEIRNPEEVSISVPDDGCLNQSSISAASLKDDTGKPRLPQVIPTGQPFPPRLPGFPGAPWPYPWNPVQWNSPVSPPMFAPAGFPLPFYSAAQPYWGCAMPGAWNVPLVIPPRPIPQHFHTPPSSGPNSPTLGKHSRDESVLKLTNTKEGEILKETTSEKSLWVPKTLRIDDPEEAAKSSLWATLGIKNDKVESGLFKAFQTQSKSDEKTCHAPDTSTVLQANPAALSRSVSFHESS